MLDYFTAEELNRSIHLKTAIKLGWLMDPAKVTMGRRNFHGINLHDPVWQKMGLKVLVHRGCGGLGDALLVTPVLRAIKERFPHCHLTYATDRGYYGGTLLDIMRHNPFIDYLCDMQEMKRLYRQFDFAINLACPANRYEVEHMGKPGKVDKDRSLIFCEHTGLMPSSMKPVYVVTEMERRWADFYLHREQKIPQGQKLVGMVTKTENRTRSWQRDKWYGLAQACIGKGWTPMIFSPHEIERRPIEGARYVFGMPFRNVAAIVNQLDLLVTPDTGVMHLGGALGIPMVTLWGSIDPAQRILYYNRVSVLVHREQFKACWPCWYSQVLPECANEKLGHEASMCMESLTVLEVLEAVGRMLDGDQDVWWQPKRLEAVPA